MFASTLNPNHTLRLQSSHRLYGCVAAENNFISQLFEADGRLFLKDLFCTRSIVTMCSNLTLLPYITIQTLQSRLFYSIIDLPADLFTGDKNSSVEYCRAVRFSHTIYDNLKRNTLTTHAAL